MCVCVYVCVYLYVHEYIYQCITLLYEYVSYAHLCRYMQLYIFLHWVGCPIFIH